MLGNFFDFWLNIFNSWFPWVSFFNETWLCQLGIIYLLILLCFSKNSYYILLYLFLEIIFIGVYISLVQGELFTGFLWVLEFTIIFIVILFLFYFNVEGYLNQINLNYNFFFFLFYFILISWIFISFDHNNSISVFFNNIIFWDDYYEAFNNKTLNDFLVLTISYYSFNSIELLLIGFLLLFGSVVCVILNRNQRLIKNAYLFVYFNFFTMFKDYFSFYFLRKQNFIYQANQVPSIRVFKKK